jgi:hypothetical protein
MEPGQNKMPETGYWIHFRFGDCIDNGTYGIPLIRVNRESSAMITLTYRNTLADARGSVSAATAPAERTLYNE